MFKNFLERFFSRISEEKMVLNISKPLIFSLHEKLL